RSGTGFYRRLSAGSAQARGGPGDLVPRCFPLPDLSQRQRNPFHPQPVMHAPSTQTAPPAMTVHLAAGETFSIVGEPRSPEGKRAVALVRDLLSRLGLTPAAEGRWRIDLGQQPPSTPGSYRLSFDAATTQWQVRAADEEGTRSALMRLL